MSADVGRLLVIDDEEHFGRMLASQLETRGHQVSLMTNGADALLAYESVAPDVVIVDLAMPGLDGLQVLSEIRFMDPSVTVILLSGEVDVRTTVKALRAGAEDVQTKPVDLDLLCAAIDRGLHRSRLVRAHRVAATQISDPYGFFDDSAIMRRVLRLVERLSQSAIPILVVGEPGTGKRVVAEMLHHLSPGADKPFVRVSCAGLAARTPQDVRADERTASKRIDVGALVARAAGSTLLLDDIAELSMPAQAALAALLSAAAEGRAGARAMVRIVATTARDLAQDVRTGTLSMELYHSLAVLPLALPSLRSRGEEAISSLATRTLQAQRFALGRGPVRLAAESVVLLAALDWPGNLQQLRDVIEEAFIVALDSDTLEPVHLLDVLGRAGLGESPQMAAKGHRSLEQMERRHIARILAQTHGHRTEAAKILGITRTTLYKKMAEYELEDVGGE